MTRDQRSQYRVATGLEAIRATLEWPERDPVSVKLIDVSQGGAAVAIDAAGNLPPIVSDTPVHLSLTLAKESRVIEVPAVIRHFRADAQKIIIGLQITAWERMAEALPPRLFALFNRRKSFRVELPKHDRQASVTIVSRPAPIEAELLDISTGGCSLMFTNGMVPEDDDIAVEFKLPGDQFEYRLHGIIRARFTRDGRASCGVEFVASRSRDFVSQQERIAQFVMGLQRQQLRQAVVR